jgi:hypothetical protein
MPKPPRHPTTPQFVDELLAAGTYDDDRTFRDLIAAPPPYARGSRPELATEKVARPLAWRASAPPEQLDDELDVDSFGDGDDHLVGDGHSFVDGHAEPPAAQPMRGASQWMRAPGPQPSAPRVTARGTTPPQPRGATQVSAMGTPAPRAATRAMGTPARAMGTPAPRAATRAIATPARAMGTPAPRAATRAIAAAAPAPAPRALSKQRSAGESIARLCYFASGALLAGAIALYGGRMWHAARGDQPAAPAAQAAPQPAPAGALLVPGGRLELAADRRNVTRLAGDTTRWTAPQSAALDSIALTGPLVIGQAADAIAAIDLDSGRTRFTWSPPADETWAAQAPLALDSCLLTTTAHGKKTVVRCLDLAAGSVKWTAPLSNVHDCTQPPIALPGAVMMQCAGWTAVIDERNGAVDIEAGAGGLVQDRPPLLLRMHGRLAIDPWSAARRRFVAVGEQGFGGLASASSAVMYKDRLVVRAMETSDELMTIAAAGGERTPINAPVYRLADSAPLVRSCGGDSSPRFQLLELAPRIGASFDPSAAADRALALVDVEHANLAWTSRKAQGLRPAGDQAPICRGGHYFVPLQITDHSGAPESVLWVLDAETGKTAAVLAPDAGEDASFAALTADQVDDDRVVVVGKHGANALAWAKPARGVHDARRDLEAALGVLP